MTKRIFQIICLIGLFTVAKAQPYGNEWIDYSKTYYKFKLGKTSLYRINYPTLISLGIPASDLKGTAFKLIRNGQQVPLYVTTNNQFGPSDFIEFYGEKTYPAKQRCALCSGCRKILLLQDLLLL